MEVLGKRGHVKERRSSESGDRSNPQGAVRGDAENLEKEHSGRRAEGTECGLPGLILATLGHHR